MMKIAIGFVLGVVMVIPSTRAEVWDILLSMWALVVQLFHLLAGVIA